MNITETKEERLARARLALSGTIVVSHEDAPLPGCPHVKICGHGIDDKPTKRGCGELLPRQFWIEKKKARAGAIAFCEECGSMA